MINGLTGIMLGYLINNFLIDSQQYQAWRDLAPDELKTALKNAGIMTATEFDDFSQQLAAEVQVSEVQSEDIEVRIG